MPTMRKPQLLALLLPMSCLLVPRSAAAFDVCNRTQGQITVAYRPNDAPASQAPHVAVIGPGRPEPFVPSGPGVLRVLAPDGRTQLSPDVAVIDMLASYNVTISGNGQYLIVSGVCP